MKSTVERVTSARTFLLRKNKEYVVKKAICSKFRQFVHERTCKKNFLQNIFSALSNKETRRVEADCSRYHLLEIRLDTFLNRND